MQGAHAGHVTDPCECGMLLAFAAPRVGAEPGTDVLLCAIGWELYGSQAASHKEFALVSHLHPLPLEEHRLGAALAAHHAYGLALDDLRLRIDAGSRPVAQAV